MIDLHTHSTASDGQYAPGALVRLARQAGVEILALTDHDTVSGLGEAAQAAERLGVQFIPGIELSVRYRGASKEMHLLGYGVNPSSPPLERMCARIFQQRKERERRIFAFLSEKGVHLAPEQVEQYAGNGLVARPHFARAMLALGYVSTLREAFDRYLATPEFDRLERPKPAPEEAIDAIRRSGGVPVLAHPVQLKLDDAHLERLPQALIPMGLRGIEALYSTHSRAQTQAYLELARTHGLLVTGGSDFHGEQVKPEIALGTGINGSLQFDDRDAVRRLCGEFQ